MSRRSSFTLALATLLLASGCTSFEMARLRNQIDHEVPEAEIGDGFALSFGRFTMGTARTVLAIADDGDESTAMARALLRNVRKVQIGRYDVNGRMAFSSVPTPSILEKYERRGWIPVATVREDDEVVWVMANEKHDDLRDLLVVVLTQDELTIAKMSGNLSEAVAAAMQESDWASTLSRSLQSPRDSAFAEPAPATDARP